MPTESQVQSAFFSWARGYGVREYPELRFMFHIPNGGARDEITGAILKRQGVKKGIWDVCLPVPRNGFHALWLEFKKPGERLSKEQEEFGEFIAAQGCAAHCVDDWQKAMKIVSEYLSQ